jgi:transcriptional regulator with XRE-family HTH domain
MATIFTRAIRDALQRENLTQVDLAKHLSVSTAYLSDVMHGNRSVSEERAQSICDLLKINMDMYYVSRGNIPTDLYDALGPDGLVRALAELRENHV